MFTNRRKQRVFSRPKATVAAAAALALALGPVGLTGCKFSNTITELVPSMDATEKVAGTPPVQQVRADAPAGDDGETQSDETAEAQGDVNQSDPEASYDEDEKEKKDKKAARTQATENSDASTDSQASESGTEAGSKGSGNSKNGTANSGSTTVKGDEPGNENEKDETKEEQGDSSTEEEKNDDDAKETAVPSGKRIAAAGEMANIVQMLTGELRADDLKGGDTANYLVATDKNFQDSVADSGVYPGEGVDQASVAWDETDGTEGGLDVSKLKKAKVDLVIYESGTDTLELENGKSAKSKLENAGIETLAIGELNQDSDIVEAVDTIAESLADGAGDDKNDIVKKAAAWEDTHDETLDTMADYNGGWALCKGSDFDGAGKSSHEESDETAIETSIFWCTTDVSWSGWDSSKMDGKACGATLSDFTRYPAAHYLCASGVWDTGAAGGATNVAGQVSTAGITRENALKQLKNSNNGLYLCWASVQGQEGSLDRSVVTYPDAFGLKILDNDYTQGTHNYWYQLSPLSAVNEDYAKRYDNGYYPGSDHFPGFIVRTEEDKKAIEASESRDNGTWHYRGVKPSETLKNMTVANRDDVPLLSGNPKVYLAPTGLLHSWLEGSAESFLLSVWARSSFYTDLSTSRAESAAEDYYEDFYRNADAAPDF